MPTSSFLAIPIVLNEMIKAQPNSILDVGVGLGKYGILAREYLDWWTQKGREGKRTHIEGIEIYQPYIEERPLDQYYDLIRIGDALETIRQWQEPGKIIYDLILACDVIEHFPRERAEELMKLLLEHRTETGQCLFTIPLGELWINNVVPGDNPAEKHLSTWTRESVEEVCGAATRYTEIPGGPKGPIGVFVFALNSAKEMRLP